jgi:hypothetical protein
MNLHSSSKLINQEIYTYYLINVDHNSMAVHLSIIDCEGFYAVLYISAMDENVDEMLCNGSEEDGNGTKECKEDECTDCEDADSDTDWCRQIESDMLCILSIGI